MFESRPHRCFVLPVLTGVVVLAAAGACALPESPADEGTEPSPLPSLSAPAEQVPEADAGESAYGPALENPEAYYGIYAGPERPNREWFVTAAERPEYADRAPAVPPGHLALGAMFGDVSPWHLRTVSPTRFERAWVGPSLPESEAVTVEFELDGSGRAVAMRLTHSALASEGRLERVGDLPEGWR